MKFRFNPSEGLIVVPTKLYGPKGDTLVRLAMDTGATGSMINWEVAVLLGYDPASVNDRVQVTTGSGVEFAPRLPIQKIKALGKERAEFPILCHTLPPTATVDGLLGLDFFRGTKFSVDLDNGLIEIA